MNPKGESSASQLTKHAMLGNKLQTRKLDSHHHQLHNAHNILPTNELEMNELSSEISNIQFIPDFNQHTISAPPNTAYGIIGNDTWIEDFENQNISQNKTITRQPMGYSNMPYRTMPIMRRPPTYLRSNIEQYNKVYREPVEYNLAWDKEFQKHKDIQKEDPDTLKKIVEPGPDQVDWSTEFQEMWKQMKENPENGILGGNPDWNEFKDLFSDEFGQKIVEEADPVYSELVPYEFEKNNQFLSHGDPKAAAIELIEQHGSLTMAALALEAAVQRDVNDDDAWKLLGMVQAENEKELAAIAALQRAVQENPKNTTALLQLAVCYINEGQVEEAHATLDRWLRTSFPDLEMLPREQGVDNHERLVNYFLEAIRKDAENPQLNSDLQMGLGLLFYNVSEFNKTVDCFTAALATKVDDYILWNRLGATLSNSGKNEEAIQSYHRALNLNPNFVRGRYNLGVSCMNMGCFKEAAEHFISALSQHVVNGNASNTNISKTLWDTLHRNFVLMERRDLALLTEQKDISVFKNEFDY